MPDLKSTVKPIKSASQSETVELLRQIAASTAKTESHIRQFRSLAFVLIAIAGVLGIVAVMN